MSPRLSFQPVAAAFVGGVSILSLLLPAACGSTATSFPRGGEDGGGGQGGEPGGGGLGGAGGCVVPRDEPQGTLTITVENHRPTTVYYSDGRGDWERCAVPFDIAFSSVPDGRVHPWADSLAEPEACKSVLDCNPGAVFEIGPGETVEFSWDGLLDVRSDRDACYCIEEVAPAPNETGEITVTLYEECSGPDGDTCSGELSLTDSFTYGPGAAVSFDVMP